MTPTTFGSYEPEMLRRLFWDSGLRRTRDGSIVISQGRGVGGSTVHNLCYAVRPPQALLYRWQVPEIWPHYNQVEQTLGVTQMQETDGKSFKRRYPPWGARGCNGGVGCKGTIAANALHVELSVFLDVRSLNQPRTNQKEQASRAWRLHISP